MQHSNEVTSVSKSIDPASQGCHKVCFAMEFIQLYVELALLKYSHIILLKIAL